MPGENRIGWNTYRVLFVPWLILAHEVCEGTSSWGVSLTKVVTIVEPGGWGKGCFSDRTRPCSSIGENPYRAIRDAVWTKKNKWAKTGNKDDVHSRFPSIKCSAAKMKLSIWFSISTWLRKKKKQPRAYREKSLALHGKELSLEFRRATCQHWKCAHRDHDNGLPQPIKTNEWIQESLLGMDWRSDW